MQIVDINGTVREVKSAALDPSYGGYVRVEFKNHHEWYSIKEFLHFNPNLKHVVEGAEERPPEVAGIVSDSTETTLTDTTQNWKKDSYMEYMIWISRGKGEGQKRSVIKNDQNTITINKPWDSKPDQSSQYVLAEHITDVPSMGNTLPQEDMKVLEEKAIQIDLARGIKPHERQYTKVQEPKAN